LFFFFKYNIFEWVGKFTYISLFSGAGVGCFGFKRAGFECVATNELIARRLEVQRCNNKCKYESGYIQGDIMLDETKRKILGEITRWTSSENINEISTIIATPPCQGMSVANHKKKDEQQRNSLVIESLKLIKEIKPKTFIIENVRAFLKTTCTDIDGKDKQIEQVIFGNLGFSYNIETRVLNFKDYGSNSSRTRTVVIGVRKELDISPSDFFPTKQKEKTLGRIIRNLPSLVEMGQISENDIYHSFRAYNPEMRNWIKDLKQGQGAFDNQDPNKRPHYYKDGENVPSKNGNGDKYTRQSYDKVAPCVHTRNDLLASQSTVHPIDDRVFSVRELMLMMTIPQNFKWGKQGLAELNKMTESEKKAFIKQNDINIRQSIGEAVPTKIFNQIAEKIKQQLGEVNDQRCSKLFVAV
jgi:DNA (cytosine-5)-methyltransferase 1